MRRPLLIAAAALLLLGGGFWFWQSRQRSAVARAPRAQPAVAPEAVSALGRLEPAGDVRKLAAPTTDFGGSPRLSELLVEEGDRVAQGQVLARFDNGPTLQAERRLVNSRITNLSSQVMVLEREINRYRQLARAGATAAADLESRELKLIELKGNLIEARNQLLKTDTDLVNTELRAPIAGTVLRLQSRVGERPGENGILELGASDRMEAVAEVYESDISRLRFGQKATVTSENGGFSGSLGARVIRISPQVRQRQVLSTDPTGDADARVVEVRLELDPADISRVRNLVGMKTITRFQP
ncbi:MAG: lipid ABC transporter permease [Cyanobium sp.]|nr:MAG: lipid ABC transporter permease [Cyanobium sp.]